MVDQQRGLIRLAVALGAPWALWWGYQAWHTYAQMRDYRAARAEWSRIGLTDIDRGRTLEALQSSLTTEIAFLVAPFIIAAVASWVYRGFKTRR
jgi:hypothetical protein